MEKWLVRRELRKSGYARKYGWYIEYKGEVIGSLENCQYYDMFWDRYEIIATDEKYYTYLHNHTLWLYSTFTLKSKHYNIAPEYYIISEMNFLDQDDKFVVIRALYLTEEQFIHWI